MIHHTKKEEIESELNNDQKAQSLLETLNMSFLLIQTSIVCSVSTSSLILTDLDSVNVLESYTKILVSLCVEQFFSYDGLSGIFVVSGRLSC